MTRTQTAPPDVSVTRRTPRPDRAWWTEMAQFLTVGGVSFVVDMGLFNLLTYGPGQVLGHKPVTAKIIAALVATLVSWIGNRHWTFSERRSRRRSHELAIYAAINGVALLVAPAVLYVTTYWVGATGQLAANVASVIGIAIGTLLRYTGYKLWAFPAQSAPTRGAHGETIGSADLCRPVGSPTMVGRPDQLP